MLEIYHFSQTEIMAFLLVVVRISAFFVTWPILSMGNVPGFAKILFSLAVAMVLFPLVGWKTLNVHTLEDEYIFLIIREAFVGILMGYLARFFFFAIEVCGHLVSDASGLSSAQVFNPAAESRTSVVEQYYMILVTMFYLLINGHHYFIGALFKSFDLVPLDARALSLVSMGNAGVFMQAIVVMGLKFAAPVVASLFTINIAMGIIGRAVPQMNVLITSLSVNVLLAFLIIFVSLPLMIDGLPVYLNETIERLFGILKGL
jgi:flagellar biosynthetic protein FliR